MKAGSTLLRSYEGSGRSLALSLLAIVLGPCRTPPSIICFDGLRRQFAKR